MIRLRTLPKQVRPMSQASQRMCRQLLSRLETLSHFPDQNQLFPHRPRLNTWYLSRRLPSMRCSQRRFLRIPLPDCLGLTMRLLARPRQSELFPQMLRKLLQRRREIASPNHSLALLSWGGLRLRSHLGLTSALRTKCQRQRWRQSISANQTAFFF